MEHKCNKLDCISKSDVVNCIWVDCVREVRNNYDSLQYKLENSSYYFYKPNSLGIDQYFEDEKKKKEYNKAVDIVLLTYQTFSRKKWKLVRKDKESVVYEKSVFDYQLRIIINTNDGGHYLHLLSELIGNNIDFYEFMDYSFELVELDKIEKYCINVLSIAERLYRLLETRIKQTMMS